MPAPITFWRDRAGHEVDFLIEERGRVHAVEAKSGATFATDFLDGLRHWKTLAGKSAGDLSLVYGGESAYTREGIAVVPWTRFSG